MPGMESLFLYGMAAFCFSLIATRIMMWIKVMDVPGVRSSHTKVTPRSGGVGVLAGFFFVIMGAYVLGALESVPSKPIVTIFASSLLIALVGFVDDVKGVTWLTRMLVQLTLATTVVLSGVTLKSLSLPLLGTIELGVLGDLLAIFWIISFTNAFNFMDGINGISGGVAIVACLALMTITQSHDLLLFSFGILPFAILGFLLFNFPKGKIFMGDVGSQFLGFLFASLSLLLPLFQSTISPFVPLMIFFIYIYETGFTLARRYGKGASLFSPHRDHLYQFLVRAGWSHGAVAFLYVLFFALQGWLATVMVESPVEDHILFFIPLIALYISYTIGVMKYAKNRGVEL